MKVVATDAHEGPVYAAEEDALYFTSTPAQDALDERTGPVVAIKRVALDGGKPVAVTKRRVVALSSHYLPVERSTQ